MGEGIANGWIFSSLYVSSEAFVLSLSLTVNSEDAGQRRVTCRARQGQPTRLQSAP